MYRINLIRKTRLFYCRRFNNKTHHGDNMRLRTKLMTIAVMLGAVQAANASDWGVYGGDTGNTRFSANTQVSAGKVSTLSVQWALQLCTNRSHEPPPITFCDQLYVTSFFGPKNFFSKCFSRDCSNGSYHFCKCIHSTFIALSTLGN